MSKPSKSTDGSNDSSALDFVEAAKAKQNSLRERLAARRQKTKNLLASIGTSGTKPLLTSSRLPSITSSTSIKVSLDFQPPKTLISTNVPKKKRTELESSTNTNASIPPKESQTLESVSEETDKPISSSGESVDLHDSTPVHSESPQPTQIAKEPTTPDYTPSPSSIVSISKKSESDPIKPSKIRRIASNHNLSNKSDSMFATSTTLTCTTISTASKDMLTNSDGPKRETSPIHSKSVQSIGRKIQSNIADNNQNSKFELENLLGAQTAREKESKRVREEIMELLNRPTTKERSLNAKFRSQGGSQVQQFCSHGTRIECSKHKARAGNRERCTKLHFRKIIHPHTDESLGDCSFLNTCFHVDTCKYVHYTIDYTDYVPSGSTNRNSANRLQNSNENQTSSTNTRYNLDRLNGDSGTFGKTNSMETNKSHNLTKPSGITGNNSTSSGGGGGPGVMDPTQSDKENGTPLNLYPPQWINCDIRLINMSILGKFSVIMADPPWDIHMELPYGTMSDDEMRRLDIPCLQDDGYLFLWVTGRAMELGRECLRLWGYQRVDEIIWVKTNQLQRLIRTGRTGHWLNHGKEHCLVGVKGNPQSVNRGLDCDIIVSEVRETSHKPDEIYGIIERLSPGTRKLELFGRPHNLQPNWITLGNQLDGTYLVDPAVVERFKKQYPNGIETKVK